MVSIRRLTARGLQVFLVLALFLPAGCAGTLVSMVVKHVAMSAAKDVAKDQYDSYKKKKEADKRSRERSSQRTTPPSAEEDPRPPSESTDRAAP